MPTKIGVHICYINTYVYLDDFFEPILINYIFKREIWPNLKTGEAMPTKDGVHTFDINPYLHEFIEPILIN